MAKALTVQDKFNNVRTLIEGSKSQIANALPKHLTPERMIRLALTCVQKTPKLLECTERSIIGSLVIASQLGLEPDGVLGHGYLVPYKGVCQFIPGYRGLMALARRSGEVSTIFPAIVYSNDDYEFEYGLDPKLKHRPTQKDDRGEMVAAYAVCLLKDGGRQFVWLWKSQVDATKARSPAGRSGPWVTDYDAMAMKTALRQLCKYLPVSVELTRAVAADEQFDSGISPDYGDVINMPAASEGSKMDQLTDDMTSHLDSIAKPDPTEPPDGFKEGHDAAKERVKQKAAARRRKRATEAKVSDPDPGELFDAQGEETPPEGALSTD